MTDALREELHRIGEGAARVAVPDDVWRRGRRARRRDRLVAGGAVLSLLVVLGGFGLVLGLPGRSEVVPAEGAEREAVPSVIHAVPLRLGAFREGADETWEPSVAETDLGIGRASVAFASGESHSLPVVITAADGAYHLLKLPGWIGTSLAGYQLGTPPLALSPDGRSLAWGWYDASTLGDATVRAGVRVADLESGKVRTIPLTGGRGVAVGQVRWSPDSRWLVWQGSQMKRWEEGHTSWERNVAGFVTPGATRSTPIQVSRGSEDTFAIDNHGVRSVSSSGQWAMEGGGLELLSVAFHVTDQHPGGGATQASPSGQSVAMRTTVVDGSAWFVMPTKRAGHGAATWGRTPQLASTRLPGDRFPDGATTEPLGWLDDDHVLELVTPASDVTDGSWTAGRPELAVVSLSDVGDPTYDVVVRLPRAKEGTGQVRAVTVAVDLLDPLKTTTRDFPAPEWPWSDERKWAVFGGIGVGALAALVFGLAYRRGRRLR